MSEYAGLEAVHHHEIQRQVLFGVMLDVIKLFRESIEKHKDTYNLEHAEVSAEETIRSLDGIISEAEELIAEDEKIQIFMRNFMEKQNVPGK